MQFQDYDPSWLITLAQNASYPPHLLDAISNCTRAHVDSADYIHFVDGANANKPGAEWQFETTLSLPAPDDEEVLLDLLKDGRIGGVELIFYEGPEKQRLLTLGHHRAT